MQATPAPIIPPPIAAPERDGSEAANPKPHAVMVAAAKSDNTVNFMS